MPEPVTSSVVKEPELAVANLNLPLTRVRVLEISQVSSGYRFFIVQCESVSGKRVSRAPIQQGGLSNFAPNI